MMKCAKTLIVSVSQENEIKYVEVEIVEFVFQCSPGFLTIKIFLNLLQIDETLAGITITSCPYFCEPSCFWFCMTIKVTEEIGSADAVQSIINIMGKSEKN